MLENSHGFRWKCQRKAILEYVIVASKDSDDFAEQLLQTDDDMLNESDIAIKQGHTRNQCHSSVLLVGLQE